MSWTRLGILLFSVVIAGCFDRSQQDTYVGQWLTHIGDCRNHGKTVIKIDPDTNKAVISFFCHTRVCEEFSGSLRPGGYLRFDGKGDGLVEAGFQTNTRIVGTWDLAMDGKDVCEGSFNAEFLSKK